jgi:hypothetical protein
MSKFAEAKKKLLEENVSTKKTFNESYFNTLTTALVNDPDYELNEVVMRKGELTPVTSTPVADFRKAVIGGIAKAAGADAAEQEKLIAEHQFGNIPWYPVVSEAITNYLSVDKESGASKKFTFVPKEDFQGSIELKEVPATIKEVRAPGSTEPAKKQRQAAHTRLKANSTCPDNLKENITE